ncbi:MAG: hypothetical protein QOD06_2772 [Candidatus Binatota bacterium]|nr:hypothetical protein [Candidatus Binatota bacterium]
MRRVVLSLCALALVAEEARAKDFLLTAVKPDKLVIVDAAARKVARTFTIPGGGPAPATIVPSPDGKVAYVLANRQESVSGIDLESGKQVFRADFSSPGMRVKGMYAVEPSPDGKELFVFQSPVKLGLDEYVVEDTRIAVYDTSAGIGAKPVRTIPAPRRTAVLAFSRDGAKLYAISWDVQILDPKTGEVLGTHGVRHWDRSGYGEPDVLALWPQWEQAGIFSTPYVAPKSNVPSTDPGAFRTGLMTIDLATGDFAMDDFENTGTVIFSSVVNPVRKDEVYMVYSTLTKLDRAKHEIVKRIEVDHTYYAVNVSTDGEEIYLGGTMNDIAVYSTKTLEKLATIEMPGGADQGMASLRIVRR